MNLSWNGDTVLRSMNPLDASSVEMEVHTVCIDLVFRALSLC